MMVLALSACSGSETPEGPRAAIEGFGEAPSGSLGLSALNREATMGPEAAREAALELIGEDDSDVRFAAAYVLALVGIEAGSADRLRPLLDVEDPSIRLLAAQTLAAAGVGEGVPVLISLLASDDPLPHTGEDLRVWQVARRTLLDVTGEDLGLGEAADVEAASATIPDWERWWASAQGSFTPEDPEGMFG
jgi:HEAT repeat protein